VLSNAPSESVLEHPLILVDKDCEEWSQWVCMFCMRGARNVMDTSPRFQFLYIGRRDVIDTLPRLHFVYICPQAFPVFSKEKR
jgi:hypothetical protein